MVNDFFVIESDEELDHDGQDHEADDVGRGEWIREARSGDAQGGISGSDGKPDAVGRVLRADRTALPEERQWPAAGRT